MSAQFESACRMLCPLLAKIDDLTGFIRAVFYPSGYRTDRGVRNANREPTCFKQLAQIMQRGQVSRGILSRSAVLLSKNFLR